MTEFFQQKTEESIKNTSNSSLEHHTNERIETLVKSKDEQISLLKQSIGFIKEQYQNEIKRLEKNQKRIIKVFNSEIKLLQSAFNEMRSIYKPKLLASEQNNQKYISINDFFLYLKQNNKNNDEIKMVILTCIKQKDPRFIYNKRTKKVLILNTDYSDLV